MNSADLLSPPVITIDWTFLLVTDSIWLIICRVPSAKPWIAPKNRSSGVVSRFKPWIDPRIFGSAKGDRLPWKSGMTRMSSSWSLNRTHNSQFGWIDNTSFRSLWFKVSSVMNHNLWFDPFISAKSANVFPTVLTIQSIVDPADVWPPSSKYVFSVTACWKSFQE